MQPCEAPTWPRAHPISLQKMTENTGTRLSWTTQQAQGYSSPQVHNLLPKSFLAVKGSFCQCRSWWWDEDQQPQPPSGHSLPSCTPQTTVRQGTHNSPPPPCRERKEVEQALQGGPMGSYHALQPHGRAPAAHLLASPVPASAQLSLFQRSKLVRYIF